MHVLITGGTGLIGTLLIQHLVSQSYQITVLSRSPQKVYSRFCKAVNCLSTLQEIKTLDEFDAVINLAGEPIADKRWTAKQKNLLCESRWKITEKLTQLIKASQSPPSVFISGSAVGYYGNQDQDLVTEATKAKNEFTHQLCQQWESLALEAESEKTRVCLLRTGIVLSKKGGALPKMLPIFNFGLGGPISHGKQFMPWIHINDMVRAICFLLDTPTLVGPFNLTAPHPVQNAQFATQLGQIIHRPAFMRVPALVLKAMMGEAAVLVLEGQQAIPFRLQQAGFVFQFNRLTEALEDIITHQEKSPLL